MKTREGDKCSADYVCVRESLDAERISVKNGGTRDAGVCRESVGMKMRAPAKTERLLLTCLAVARPTEAPRRCGETSVLEMEDHATIDTHACTIAVPIHAHTVYDVIP